MPILDFSDFEFDEPVTTKAIKYIDQNSLTKTIEAAVSDRYTSKRTAKHLEYRHGVNGTTYQQQLWVVRFNTFREHILRQELKSPPTDDDMKLMAPSISKSWVTRFKIFRE